MVNMHNDSPDTEPLSSIAAALRDSASVDDERIVLRLDADTVVLSGAVATPEQATQAALLAEELADAVRSELFVDRALREDPTQLDAGNDEEVDDSSRRGTELSIEEQGGFVATDIDESLNENIPLDPPDEPSWAPTLDEQRGIIDGPVSDEPIAEAGDLDADEAEETAPSLADLSPAELARSAEGTATDDDKE